jgi:hypothetical protein
VLLLHPVVQRRSTRNCGISSYCTTRLQPQKRFFLPLPPPPPSQLRVLLFPALFFSHLTFSVARRGREDGGDDLGGGCLRGSLLPRPVTSKLFWRASLFVGFDVRHRHPPAPSEANAAAASSLSFRDGWRDPQETEKEWGRSTLNDRQKEEMGNSFSSSFPGHIPKPFPQLHPDE